MAGWTGCCSASADGPTLTDRVRARKGQRAPGVHRHRPRRCGAEGGAQLHRIVRAAAERLLLPDCWQQAHRLSVRILRPGGYLSAVQAYLAPLGLCLLKVKLTDGRLDLSLGTARPLCLLTGKSPRGGHSHAVVARVCADGTSFDLYHDPHPDGGGIDGDGNWAGFIVSLQGGCGSALLPATKRSRTGQCWRASLQFQEYCGSSNSTSTVTLRVGKQATKEAARAALADLLHERVFDQPISADDVMKNFKDYTTAEGFLQSIEREHESPTSPTNASRMIWRALYEAICTLKVEAD